MNKQTKIQIACILSDIFLESALHYKDTDTIDERLTKAYYMRITNEILQIYPCFSKKDLDSIFPAIAYKNSMRMYMMSLTLMMRDIAMKKTKNIKMRISKS